MILPGTYSGTGNHIHVVIETPKGSRNKFNYDEASQLFRFSKVMPAGFLFPFDFGFIPHTLGDDGDPLDALVMMDGGTYPGCFIECRLLGVIKAEQRKKLSRLYRNDRFVCVPAGMKEFADYKTIKDIGKKELEGIVKFFEDYNKRVEKDFKFLGLSGPKEAHVMIKKNSI